MTHYLLIHGSWHGAWCWYKIAPRLRANGHQVSVPDLPGRMSRPKRPILVGLTDMEKSVAPLLENFEKTTIVVHSRYGILASRLAESYPDKIERVIYLASYMIPPDTRAGDFFRKDSESALTPFVKISKTGLWDRLDPKIYRDGLYHDCDEEDNMLGHLLLGKEPLRPALTKLCLSADRYGQVKKAYIRLTEDRAVSPSLQDHFLNQSPVDRVESLTASHSAYFSQPDKLTELILKLSRD